MSAPASDTLLTDLATAYQLTDVRVIERVRSNLLRIAADSGEFAVKLYARSEQTRGDTEAALITHLQPPEPQYRVQTLVRTDEGDATALVGDHAVVVTEWVRGQFKPYTQIVEREWRALGTQLASLHVRLETFDAYPLPALSETIASRDLAAERQGLVALHARVPADLQAHLSTMLSVLDAHGAAAVRMPAVRELPIHNDYNQFNYLFDDTLPPVILDWEGAIAAAREYEVVRCMNHLPLVEPGCATAFLRGYREVRALDAGALRWAVDASLVDHALKRWPIDQWLGGDPNGETAVRRSSEVLRALATSVDEVTAFFATHAAR